MRNRQDNCCYQTMVLSYFTLQLVMYSPNNFMYLRFNILQVLLTSNVVGLGELS